MLLLGKDEHEILYGEARGVSPAMMTRVAFVENLRNQS